MINGRCKGFDLERTPVASVKRTPYVSFAEAVWNYTRAVDVGVYLPYRDPVWLYEQYWINDLSMSQMAKLAGCSYGGIVKNMKKFGIPRRSDSESVKLSYNDKLRAERSAHSKRLWASKEHSEHMAEIMSTAEWKEMLSDRFSVIVKNAWKNPVYRELRSNKGENNPNWRGGISYEPYSSDFNLQFKEMIRELDGRRCVVCNVNEDHRRLDVHHINYDKKHTATGNCVALCNSCHMKTNYNRVEWTAYFEEYLGVS